MTDNINIVKLIGGPCDGENRAIPDDLYDLLIPAYYDMPPVKLADSITFDPNPPKFQIHVYTPVTRDEELVYQYKGLE